MEIKKNLKELDIKISKMANELGISRPTFDLYIENYEKGIKIPNDIFQEIFDFLFNEEISSTIEFAQKYQHVKNVMLNSAKNDINEIKNLNREQKINSELTSIINNEVYDSELKEFFGLFASNSNNELVKSIYTYFNIINGLKKFDGHEYNSNQLHLFSNLNKLFDEFQKEKQSLNVEYFKLFVDKSETAYLKRNKPKDEDIIKYIKSNMSDEKELDVNVLKEMIKSMEE